MTRWHVELSDGAQLAIDADSGAVDDSGTLIFMLAGEPTVILARGSWSLALRGDADIQRTTPSLPPAKPTPRAV